MVVGEGSQVPAGQGQAPARGPVQAWGSPQPGAGKNGGVVDDLIVYYFVPCLAFLLNIYLIFVLIMVLNN